MNKKYIVINCARELFNKYGYKKVTMDEVAREANVTKKTIYSYFKDKEELFNYFIDEEIQDFKSQIESDYSKKSFIDNLTKSIMIIFKLRKESLLVQHLIKESNDVQAISFLKRYDDDILKFIEEKIDLAKENNQIKKCDSHLTAFIIYKIFISVLFEYEGELDENKITKEITSILKDGLIN